MQPHERELFQQFMDRNEYLNGSYDNPQGYERLDSMIKNLNADGPMNRIFYMALPSSVVATVASNIRLHCSVMK